MRSRKSGARQVIENIQGFHGRPPGLETGSQQSILQTGGNRRRRRRGGRGANHPHLNSVCAADRAADRVLLFESGQRVRGNCPLPDLACQQLQQFFGRGVLNLASVVDDDDFGGSGLHIGDDVGGRAG